MTTDVDICNRALLFLGVQRIISGLTQDSVEAKACNTIYTNIRDWCLGVNNWNFARKTAKLTLLKANTSPVVAPWVSTEVSPAWLYAFGFPADALVFRYVTNSDPTTDNLSYLGEPKRFVVANDTIAAAVQPVVLTNESSAVGIYTGKITDPTLWPWYFERFVVSNLAWNLSMALLENEKLTEYLDHLMMRYFDAAYTANLAEGMTFGDTTPEWIQALGINYPFRRNDGKPLATQQEQPVQPNDNRRR